MRWTPSSLYEIEKDVLALFEDLFFNMSLSSSLLYNVNNAVLTLVRNIQLLHYTILDITASAEVVNRAHP